LAAALAMLEAGMVAEPKTSHQCPKISHFYSIAGLIVLGSSGYNLMYSGVDGGIFGTPST